MMKITIGFLGIIGLVFSRYVDQSDNAPLDRLKRDLIGFNRQQNIASNVNQNLENSIENEDLKDYKRKIARYLIKNSSYNNIFRRFQARKAEIRKLKLNQALKRLGYL